MSTVRIALANLRVPVAPDESVDVAVSAVREAGELQPAGSGSRNAGQRGEDSRGGTPSPGTGATREVKQYPAVFICTDLPAAPVLSSRAGCSCSSKPVE